MLSRDERRRRAIASLREVLAIRPTDEYARKLVYGIEMVLDSCESVDRRTNSPELTTDAMFGEGVLLVADEVIYSLYGYLVGALPDAWYADKTTEEV